MHEKENQRQKGSNYDETPQHSESKFVSKLMKEKYDGKRKNLLRNNEFNYSGTMVRDIELWS